MTSTECGRVESRGECVYLERGRLSVERGGIVFSTEKETIPIPAAGLALVQLGPGVSVTSAAVEALGECGCAVVWVGEGGTRFSVSGGGGVGAEHLLWQARCSTTPRLRRKVIRRLFRMRFGEEVAGVKRVDALLSMEGRRVRGCYVEHAERSGARWNGRVTTWSEADAPNRALSVANSCLYGVCQCAVTAGGYSPALGFVHTGDMRSFVFDVADLYKHEVTIPLAFDVAAEGSENIGRRTRRAFIEKAREVELLKRIIPDIQEALHDPAARA